MADVHGNPDIDEFMERKYTQAHKVMDTNQDGEVTEEDFVLIAERAADKRNLGDDKRSKLKQELAKIYRVFFNSSGGSCDLKSFISNARKVPKEVTARHATTFYGLVFDTVDRTKTGYLSEEQVVNCYDLLNIDNDSARKIFNAMDVQQNGQLTREELIDFGVKFSSSNDRACPSRHLWGILED